MLMTRVRKIKVSQFYYIFSNFSKIVSSNIDWFSFETRVRGIVYGLLNDPMEKVKSMIQFQEKIDEKLEFNKRRVDELEFLLYKFQKRTDMETEYESRISKMEKETKS
jgi:hypothetical protein